MDLETIRQEARAVAEELITTAQMKPGQILVVGCSSSEIHNSKLGTDSSQEIGQAVFEALCACTKEHGLYLAAQCCEHLNRAVVLERAAAEKYGYEPVCAVILLKSILFLSILAGVPVLKRNISTPWAFKESVR